MTDKPGPLIAVGGHEDKEGERTILKAVAERLNGGRLVVATVASQDPEPYLEAYQAAFGALGVSDVAGLYLDNRGQAEDEALRALIAEASGIFFTGGDQLRIASQIGDTPLETEIHRLQARGGVVAGTSAGASMQSEVMLVYGSGRETHRIGDGQMAPGLNLIPGVIIDQHFAERGRIGRLLGAVAHNPRLLGIGIDEDTAIVVDGKHCRVIGSGGVTIVDAGRVSWSNIAEARRDSVLSIHDVVMHVLAAGDRFDLQSRRPAAAAS